MSKKCKYFLSLFIAGLLTISLLLGVTGCGRLSAGDGVRVIRIGHNQSTTHPTHLGLLAFKEYIESHLGDRYRVEIYPSELLGSQNNMVQLTQTGAIDMCVASNALLGSFSQNYDIFNLPYLFASAEAYHAAMDDPAVTDPIFHSTAQAGFTAVTWLDAGTRNFYTIDKPIRSPRDLGGLKIRVQQSKINVRMMELLGGTATPMGFGDVYTALQSKIIDGAENNELSLTSNGHGDVCKYYSYDMHQMIPDIVIANNRFLAEIKDTGDAEVFMEAFRVLNKAQRENWESSVAAAKIKAERDMGVKFIYPDQQPFVEACRPLTEEVLATAPTLRSIYDAIQAYNFRYPAATKGD